ncbi:Gfo/Idh/MocA family oxidoreductase [Sinorhizobium meliloti]|uniref:Gfo/Idh/MocA family protein n=1 Tax=Rhizobium meliloti TaxID=382 RepID=UPI00237FFDFE|nr:Gfo/Idh/MocA family oxidoreductase [Sinorhizobium meliloti]MDE3775500.1 Gfo/Idh/MocA family oxidoreductase [Sinorhizobium meliloti]
MTTVALIDTAHWHVPLYLDALEKADVQIVGVSDPTGTTCQSLAQRFHTRCFATCEELLNEVRPELAFVFGRHVDMPQTANLLLDRDIPFAIEKPCGLRAADVRRLAEKAFSKRAFVAIPFIFRLSDTWRIIRNGQVSVKFDHASFRFIAGPPSRYERASTPWMLNREVSGGGPLINVGVHLIDLFLVLSGSEVVAVTAFSTSHINNLSIEDFITVTLQCASGAVGIIECGYTFPSSAQQQREFTFSLRAGDRFLRSVEKGIEVIHDGPAGVVREFKPAEFETDLYYSDFVEHVLAALQENSPTCADFRDATGVLEVVEAAYKSAAEGGRLIRLHV